MTRFTLHLVASRDGYIARRPGQPPAEWASAEEQALFLAAVGRADWSVMGRATHEAAFREDRRRIVFSTSAPRPEWRSPNHLWLDPEGHVPEALAPLVERARRMREAAVLGGVRVHDWFHRHGRLDRVFLTVEPVAFGGGLPIFSDQTPADALGAFLEKGYEVGATRKLNAAGTTLLELAPGAARAGEERS